MLGLWSRVAQRQGRQYQPSLSGLSGLPGLPSLPTITAALVTVAFLHSKVRLGRFSSGLVFPGPVGSTLDTLVAASFSTCAIQKSSSTAWPEDQAPGKRWPRGRDRGWSHVRHQDISRIANMMDSTLARDFAHILDRAPILAAALGHATRSGIDALQAVCGYRESVLARHALGEKRKRRRRTPLLDTMRERWVADDQQAGTAASLSPIEEAIIIEEGAYDPKAREPFSPVEFSRTIATIDDMVDRLLWEAHLISEEQFPGLHRLPSHPESVWGMIRMLKGEGYPRYTHPQLDPAAATESRRRLNETNRTILSGWIPHRMLYLVGKICYNLLVCSVPPGISAYNFLILGFTYLGQHRLARVVVDSFLFKSMLRPSPATYPALLQHFRLKRDILGFVHMLQRLTGHDPRGMKLGTLSMREVQVHMKKSRMGRPHSAVLQKWIEEAELVVSGDYVVEIPKFDRPVFEVLLEGFMDFNLVGHASRVFILSLHERCLISLALVDRLLHNCILNLDSFGISVLVQGLLQNVEVVTGIITGDPSANTIRVRIAHKIRILLRLFSSTVLPVPYEKESHAAFSGYGSQLSHFATVVWLAETMQQLDFENSALRRLKVALRGRSQLHIKQAIEFFNHMTMRRQRELARSDIFGRLMKMYWLVSEMHRVGRKASFVDWGLNDMVAVMVLRRIAAETASTDRYGPYEGGMRTPEGRAFVAMQLRVAHVDMQRSMTAAGVDWGRDEEQHRQHQQQQQHQHQQQHWSSGWTGWNLERLYKKLAGQRKTREPSTGGPDVTAAGVSTAQWVQYLWFLYGKADTKFRRGIVEAAPLPLLMPIYRAHETMGSVSTEFMLVLVENYLRWCETRPRALDGDEDGDGDDDDPSLGMAGWGGEDEDEEEEESGGGGEEEKKEKEKQKEKGGKDVKEPEEKKDGRMEQTDTNREDRDQEEDDERWRRGSDKFQALWSLFPRRPR